MKAQAGIRMTTPENPCTRSLHGVRGLAVLIVLFSHAGIHQMAPAFFNLDGAGKYGVYLFFCLSAFLLTAQLLALSEDQLVTSIYWKNYFLRRVLRIFPLYAVALFSSFFAQISFGPPPLSLGKVFQYLAFYDVHGIFWTIPTEVKFYLLIPLLTFGVVFGCGRDLRKSILFLCVLIMFSGLYDLFLPPHEVSTSLSAYVTIFLSGSLGALLHQQWFIKHQLSRGKQWGMEGAAWLSLLLFVLFVPKWLQLIFPSVDVHYFRLRLVMLFGILWLVFILGQLHGAGLLRRILEHPVLTFSGRISYSAYVWHWPVYARISALPYSAEVKFVLGLAAVYAVAFFSYCLIERPLLKISLLDPSRISGTDVIPPSGMQEPSVAGALAGERTE